MEEKILDNQYCTAQLIDGIVEVQYKAGLHITLTEAKEIVKARLDFFGELQFPTLLKSSRIKTIDKAARDFLFKEGQVNITAMALIQTSKVEKVVVNIIQTYNKPSIPCKAFESEESARKWLRQYIIAK